MTTENARVDGQIQDGIGWIIFNNPAKMNALSAEMMAEVAHLVKAFEADPLVKVVVMRGAGEKAFVSGGDISKFGGEGSPLKQPSSVKSESLNDVMLNLTKPLIAMIHGYCLGGGLAMALRADLRFASTTCQLGVPAALRGLVYSYENLERLVGLVGASVAKDLMFSARRVGGEEALRIGLVNRVFEPGQLEDETVAYARAIASNAPLSVRASKFIIRQIGMEPEKRDHASIGLMAAEAMNSEDFKEATQAFLEKRRPVFRGH